MHNAIYGFKKTVYYEMVYYEWFHIVIFISNNTLVQKIMKFQLQKLFIITKKRWRRDHAAVSCVTVTTPQMPLTRDVLQTSVQCACVVVLDLLPRAIPARVLARPLSC